MLLLEDEEEPMSMLDISWLLWSMMCDVVDGFRGSGGDFFDDALRWVRAGLAGCYKTCTREQVYCNITAGGNDSSRAQLAFAMKLVGTLKLAGSES